MRYISEDIEKMLSCASPKEAEKLIKKIEKLKGKEYERLR